MERYDSSPLLTRKGIEYIARETTMSMRTTTYNQRQTKTTARASAHTTARDWVRVIKQRESGIVSRPLVAERLLRSAIAVFGRAPVNNIVRWTPAEQAEKPLPRIAYAAPVADALKKPGRMRKMALLLPGHNEELIIATTIRTAIAGGQDKRDIYVVDDNSSDATRQKAVELLGDDHVLSVERSGKALAVKKAIEHFNLATRYRWLHVADADSVFCPDYFRIYKKKLDHKKYAVAVGFVQSMRGNWISTYRAATYTYSQHVNRRIQSHLNMISVFPGPITCFRTDILSKLDFQANTLTEDFDITLQVHRYKLGKILYIPQAINYTQDPQDLRDFCKQNLRWQRGFFQGVKKYKIGRRLKAIDVSLGFQMWQAIFYLFQMFVLIPYLIATTGNWNIIPVVLAADFLMTGIIVLLSSAVIKRWNLISALPYFYFLRWLEIGIFVVAFVEIYLLRKFRTEIVGWATEGRRYKPNAQALQDVATV